MKTKYLEFYSEKFGDWKFCTKSWGFASFEAGAESRQAEIDELRKRIDDALKELNEVHMKGFINKPLAIVNTIDILKGENND